MIHGELFAAAIQGDRDALSRLVEAGDAGDADALLWAGRYFDPPTGRPGETDPRRARMFYHRGAQLGHPDSQYHYANMCDYGEGGPRDWDEARRWYGAAAQQGLATAQMTYGTFLQHGRGGPRKPEEAARWYLRAIEQGDPLAATNLALMHLRKEVGPDYQFAIRLLESAALAGDWEAHRQLGILQAGGALSEPDLESAVFHFLIAYALAPEGSRAPLEVWLSEVFASHPGLEKPSRAQAEEYLRRRFNRGAN